MQQRHALSSLFKNMGSLNPKSLKEYFVARLNSCRKYSQLRYEYVNLRRVWNFSYYMVNDYPQISLLATEIPAKTAQAPVDREAIERAILRLRNEGDLENCLMLILISRYHLLPSALVLIRFEDFGTRRDGRRFLNIFARKRKRYDTVLIDEETFAVVRGLKKLRQSHKRQQYETKRRWSEDRRVTGYFIFPVQRCSIGRRLQNGFNGRIPEFSSSAQSIIQVCTASGQ